MFRIIATTNAESEARIEEKTFREDLYYRLNVIPVKIPPLRERGNDISLLIEYFLKKYSQVNERRQTGIDERCGLSPAKPIPGREMCGNWRM